MTEEELKKENEELKEENKLFKQALEAISKINGGAAIVARDVLGIKKIEVISDCKTHTEFSSHERDVRSFQTAKRIFQTAKRINF